MRLHPPPRPKPLDTCLCWWGSKIRKYHKDDYDEDDNNDRDGDRGNSGIDAAITNTTAATVVVVTDVRDMFVNTSCMVENDPALDCAPLVGPFCFNCEGEP